MLFDWLVVFVCGDRIMKEDWKGFGFVELIDFLEFVFVLEFVLMVL